MSPLKKSFKQPLQHSSWLMKSEPTNYSIDDLKREKVCLWDGVRNYQARNFMMKDMKKGHDVFFYHSNIKIPAIVGLAKVISEHAIPDPTQFNPQSQYFDKKATPNKPIWYCVQVRFQKKLQKPIILSELKSHKKLTSLWVIRKGMRLSVQPITQKDCQTLLQIISNQKN